MIRCLRIGHSFAAFLLLAILPGSPSQAGDWKREQVFPDLAVRIARPESMWRDFIAVSPGDFDGDGRVDFAGPTRYAGVALARQTWPEPT